MPNCYWATSGAVPWQHWIQSGELEAPSATGCRFKNYYKPTGSRCLMGSPFVAEMCASCAEAQVLAIFRQTAELSGARCPRPDETLVVVANADKWHVALSRDYFTGGKLLLRDLSLDAHAFAADAGFPAAHPRARDGRLPLRIDRGAINTTWTWPSGAAGPTGSLASPAPIIEFDGQTLGVGEHAFELRVTDASQFVVKTAWGASTEAGRAVARMDQVRARPRIGGRSRPTSPIQSADLLRFWDFWDRLCTAGAKRAHVSKTTRRSWREETSSNTCGCSNTTEQSASEMSDIPTENAHRHTIGIVGNKVRGMG